MMGPLRTTCLLLVILSPLCFALQHPAGWHTKLDIARIRKQIAAGAEPWATAYSTLMNYSSRTMATVGYLPSPVSVVHRDCCNEHPDNTGNRNFEQDAINAYYLMVKWIATSNTSYADTAEAVIDAWSASLRGFAGHDQMLAAGIYGSHMAQAAELLAHAKPTWALKARAQRMFREAAAAPCHDVITAAQHAEASTLCWCDAGARQVIHPVCDQFCGRSSSGPPMPRPQTCSAGANGNWDACCMSGVASWAVFLDNRCHTRPPSLRPCLP